MNDNQWAIDCLNEIKKECLHRSDNGFEDSKTGYPFILGWIIGTISRYEHSK